MVAKSFVLSAVVLITSAGLASIAGCSSTPGRSPTRSVVSAPEAQKLGSVRDISETWAKQVVSAECQAKDEVLVSSQAKAVSEAYNAFLKAVGDYELAYMRVASKHNGILGGVEGLLMQGYDPLHAMDPASKSKPDEAPMSSEKDRAKALDELQAAAAEMEKAAEAVNHARTALKMAATAAARAGKQLEGKLIDDIRVAQEELDKRRKELQLDKWDKWLVAENKPTEPFNHQPENEAATIEFHSPPATMARMEDLLRANSLQNDISAGAKYLAVVRTENQFFERVASVVDDIATVATKADPIMKAVETVHTAINTIVKNEAAFKAAAYEEQRKQQLVNLAAAKMREYEIVAEEAKQRFAEARKRNAPPSPQTPSAPASPATAVTPVGAPSGASEPARLTPEPAMGAPVPSTPTVPAEPTATPR